MNSNAPPVDTNCYVTYDPDTMKTAFLVVTFTVTLSAQQFGGVEYFQRVAKKDKTEKIDGKLIFDKNDKDLKFLHKKDAVLKVPGGSITNIVYERAAKPRYAAGLLLAWPLLFTKSKSHFLTFQFKEAGGDGQYAVFRLDKGNFREVLAAAESFTGKPVQRTEEH